MSPECSLNTESPLRIILTIKSDIDHNSICRHIELNQKSGRTGDLRPNKPEQPDLDELTGVLGAEAELNSGWREQRRCRSAALSATAAVGADFRREQRIHGPARNGGWREFAELDPGDGTTQAEIEIHPWRQINVADGALPLAEDPWQQKARCPWLMERGRTALCPWQRTPDRRRTAPGGRREGDPPLANGGLMKKAGCAAEIPGGGLRGRDPWRRTARPRSLAADGEVREEDPPLADGRSMKKAAPELAAARPRSLAANCRPRSGPWRRDEGRGRPQRMDRDGGRGGKGVAAMAGQRADHDGSIATARRRQKFGSESGLDVNPNPNLLCYHVTNID
jgi:hypothetical protein